MHQRHQLTLLLWPNSEPGRGRALLCGSLYHLHRCIDAGAGPTHRPHLKSELMSLGLDAASGLWLDVQVLQAAWEPARMLPQELSVLEREERCQHVAQLEGASQLVRWPFLEGFSLRDAAAFEDWVSFQRSCWSLRLHVIFERLSYLQELAGEIEHAAETVNRWIAFDPLHEEAYVRMMRLHLALGDRAAALRTYGTCSTVLAAELQADPNAETVALAERIRSGSPLQQQAPPRQSPLSPSDLAPD